MVGQGRTIGLVLIVLSVVAIALVVLLLLSGIVEGRLRMSGFLLGLAMVLSLGLPVLGVGALLVIRGGREIHQFAEVEKEKRILNIIQAQGQVNVGELALEMNLHRESIRDMVYDLVGKGLFTGYINWDDGILYSKQAAEMQTTKCPNCGGERELVGKGVVTCPYCGIDLFV